LQYERTSIGGIGGGTQKQASLEEVVANYAGEDDRVLDSHLRGAVVRHRINDRAFALTVRRSLEQMQAGVAPGPESSMFKYYGTEQNKGRYEILLQAMGTRALGWEGNARLEPAELDTTRAWLRSKANSIEGGTSEVQLNIIAKRVLGLPD
jgi:alkylation response protein AidB-like acyl-CoA dehydrogenase